MTNKFAQYFGLPAMPEEEVVPRKVPARSNHPVSFNLPELPDEKDDTPVVHPKAKSTPNFGLPDLPEEEVSAPVGERSMRTAPYSALLASGIGAVKAMQQAIMQFAENVSATDPTSMHGNQAGQEKGKNNEYLGGSDPFGDFLADHIKQKGNAVQYLNTDVSSQDRGRMSIEDTGLRGIVDTIKRIGYPGSEKGGIDGVWGQRTNNALHQIAQLMQTIDHLSQSMNVPIKGLNKTVEVFSDSLPKSTVDIPSNKVSLAEKLQKLIADLSSFFSQFKKAVLTNADLRDYIDQRKSFVSYQQKPANGRDALSNVEKQVFVGNRAIPNLTINNIPISLGDLDTMSSFTALMEKAGRDPKNPEQIKTTLAEITNKLNAEKVSNES